MVDTDTVELAGDFHESVLARSYGDQMTLLVSRLESAEIHLPNLNYHEMRYSYVDSSDCDVEHHLWFDGQEFVVSLHGSQDAKLSDLRGLYWLDAVEQIKDFVEVYEILSLRLN